MASLETLNLLRGEFQDWIEKNAELNFDYVCVISNDPVHPDGAACVCAFLCNGKTPRECAGHITIFDEKDAKNENINLSDFFKFTAFCGEIGCKVEVDLDWYSRWVEF
ncbi:MAG: hypothetical protein LBU36_00425 [Clostridiales bacterium]|jgi:hypothetical protein|nr:hypothetical protein [Clostridiales bacterium]